MRNGVWAILLPALAALVLHVGLLARYVVHHRGDLSVLVCVGPDQAGHFPYERVTSPLGVGYDGQFFYALARNPWGPRHTGFDFPGVRQLRILYPATCWLLSGGHPVLLFWVMPAVNLLAIATLAGLGAWLALRHGMSPWWGFLLPLALNPVLPALRNLSDPLSTLALFALLAAWIVRGPALVVTACAAAALFCREQNAAIVGLVLVGAVLGRCYRVAGGLAAVLLVWAGWVATLHGWYGEWPFLPAQGNFAWPFEGFLFRWTHLAWPSPKVNDTLAHLVAMLGLTVQSGLAVWLLVRAGPGRRTAPLVALAGTALMALTGVFIWEDAWSYMRVLVWLPLGVWLAALQARRGWVLLLQTPAVFPTLVLLRLV